MSCQVVIGSSRVTAIRAEAATPKYQQLAHLIRERIDRGEFAQGDRIPSEAQLGDSYKISRITIRQALSGLERDGLLERVPGKGTFVRKRSSLVERATGLTGFGENVAALGIEPGYRTLRAELARVPMEIADRLRLQSPKAFVVDRVLLADGEPVAKHISYLPPWIVKKATPNSFTTASLDKGSLYRAIEQAGVRMCRADEVVEPGLASDDEAEQMEMKASDLVLRVTRTVYDADGVPLEHVLLTYRADSYTYRATLYSSRCG